MNAQFSKVITGLLLVSGIALTGCSFTVNGASANMIIGSGKAITEQPEVSGVNTVVLANGGQLIVDYGQTDSLSVTADDNIMPLLTTKLTNGRLTLGTKPSTSYNTRTPIVYRLTVKSLSAIEIAGSGSATLNGVNVDSFSAKISGSGSIVATGSVKSQDVLISGSGSYNGATLDSQQATVTCSGSGSAVVRVSEALKATVSGSGSVGYMGSPQTIDKHVTGSGSVYRR